MKLKVFFILFIILGFIVSCAPKKKIEVLQQKTSNLEKGNSFWKNGDIQRACYYYKIVLNDPQTPEEIQIFTIKRLIICSLEEKDLALASSLFNKWQKLDLAYNTKWDYYRLYGEFLIAKGGINLFYSNTMDILQKTTYIDLKKSLFIFSEKKLLLNKRLDLARELFDIFGESFSQQDKYEIFKALLDFIKNHRGVLSAYDLSKLSHVAYPDKLILWEKVKNMVEIEELSWLDGYGILKKIVTKDLLIGKLLSKEFESLSNKLGIPKIEIALLLPIFPPYENMSFGILRGVEAGVWDLEELGIYVNVKVFNTGDKNWEKRFLDSAKKGMIVGGPMRLEVWETILKNGYADKFNFFVFRSDIPMEGQKGYRFFPSRADQARALIKFLKDNFGVCTYGIFYPKGDYGRSLGEAFFNEVKNAGCEVTAISWYDPKKTRTWQIKVGELLGAPLQIFKEKDEQKIEEFKPELDFEAIFIPDEFDVARIIIPSFFYFNAKDLYFLGPALWGGENFDLTTLEYSLFKKTYFSSPWKLSKDNAQQEVLKRDLNLLSKRDMDFFTCLGYDFFRYAVWLDNEIRNGKGVELNNLNFKWTMAPIHWDENGVAHQDMFVINVREINK